MACLLKAPKGKGKGCITITTPERDNLIAHDPALRQLLWSLKTRYFIGLHHNWHDYAFRYDPVFDFSMAGDGDLKDQNSAAFAQIPLDACNFVPPCFTIDSARSPFWDVLNVGRAVAFKGIPQFFKCIRMLYDAGHKIRVLSLFATSSSERIPEIDDLRVYFESMFSPVERQLFSLVTMNWDYPFPFDLQTLAFFYRSSRVFVHAAPDERRCRTAAYAWASGIPVISRPNVASILPPAYARPPFYFGFCDPGEMPEAILTALSCVPAAERDWVEVAAEFQAETSSRRFDFFLAQLAAGRGDDLSPLPVSSASLDIRLGRHHGLSVGQNRVEQTLRRFLLHLAAINDAEIQRLAAVPDPELHLQQRKQPQ
jgi:glycosyltransferase involved in cell wall biosynthesis